MHRIGAGAHKGAADIMRRTLDSRELLRAASGGEQMQQIAPPARLTSPQTSFRYALYKIERWSAN
jgi:hypothetical protein